MYGNPNLIQCADHNWSPWHICCIHLMEHKCTQAVKIPLHSEDLREIDGDYICPECDKEARAKGDFNAIFKSLRCVCMHCMRRYILPKVTIINNEESCNNYKLN